MTANRTDQHQNRFDRHGVHPPGRPQRLDWATFFCRVPHPHGVRVRLTSFDATSAEGRRAEKRLLRIVRARATGEAFALRRAFTPGPAVIDCVFREAELADELANQINAAPVNPPIGWATGRELVADDPALRRLFKLGAEARGSDKETCPGGR